MSQNSIKLDAAKGSSTADKFSGSPVIVSSSQRLAEDLKI